MLVHRCSNAGNQHVWFGFIRRHFKYLQCTFHGLVEFFLLTKRVCQVDPDATIVRCIGCCVTQENLRFPVLLVLDREAGEQPGCFNMIGVTLENTAVNFFCFAGLV